MSSEQTSHAHTNNLISENSPYLLQHAHNPVDWYPWGEEALARAKKEDKLLLISIGYAACHWCHVMEHESFEDLAVADSMNTSFINIKVDREERPDIDDVYMTACQLSNGRGCGWPLNAFALPDGRPVWAGTYFPKEQWLKILKQFDQLWKTDRSKLEEYADKLTKGVQAQDQIIVGAPRPFERAIADTMAQGLLRTIDWERGGRTGAPKFPMPVIYEYLLDYGIMYQHDRALEAVNVTLDEMARGGIYDQLGGGFSRYSVDANWLVPHFEKMLYDNGQLMSLYSKAYQTTGKEQYRHVVSEIFDWLTREMTDSSGGFYSALDADSEGEEGKFYVWSWDELKGTLIEDDFNLFTQYYGCTEEGNWEHGKNILHMPKDRASFLNEHQLKEEELDQLLSRGKRTLMEARDERVRPGLDDKVLTAWNALMLRGLTDAFKATGEEQYRQAALRNATFIETNLVKENGRVDRNYKGGSSKINGFIDDYALLGYAYAGLYEITFDKMWLTRCDQLVEYVQEHFYNEDLRLYNYTSDLDPPLVARKLKVNDDVIPGSNSVMTRLLNFLSHYLGKEEYARRSDQMLFSLIDPITQSGQTAYYANWARAYLEKLHPTFEVVVMGSEYESINGELQKHYLPNAIYMGGNEENLPLLEYKLNEEQTTIYICQNKVCQFPVTEVKDALEQISY
ncbi:MAG: thioredoxin domain-containing protein [Saprospiraceae bacterium]|nr:thioredoxin domain-containing protein [Saprospiraceae bacterium]